MTDAPPNRQSISARLPVATLWKLKNICDVWEETTTSALERSIRTADASFGLSEFANDLFLQDLRRSESFETARLLIDTETLEVEPDPSLSVAGREIAMKAAIVPIGQGGESQLVLFPSEWSMPKASELLEAVLPRPVLVPPDQRFTASPPALVAVRVGDLGPSPTMAGLLAEMPAELLESFLGVDPDIGEVE